MDPACEALKTHIQELIEELNQMRGSSEGEASGAEEEEENCGEGTSAVPDKTEDNMTEGAMSLEAREDREGEVEQVEEQEEEEAQDQEPDLVSKLVQEMKATLNSMAGEDFDKLQEAAARANEEITKIKTILEFLERIEDESLRMGLKYQYLESWIEEHCDEEAAN